jgi:DNA polymerase elongation subunit (family B)
MINNGPKVLLVDIETSPIISYTWGIWDQNVALNQIKEDWYVLSYGAKWLGEDKILYKDSRGSKNISDDSKLLKGIWELLDQADIVITQNGKKFDIKKLNARFIINGFKPPSPFQQIDTLELAKKHFGFTSNKLEYLADKINVKYKKLKHEEFSGFELWRQCLAGNLKAWKAMEKYNVYDVLSLEELYNKLSPWGKTIDFNLYRVEGTPNSCNCGSTQFIKKGYNIKTSGKYARYKCAKCGKAHESKQNLLSIARRKSLLKQ